MALLTLAEAKLQLNIESSDTSEDVEVQSYVDSVSAAVTNVTGPVENASFTETHAGGPYLALGRVPVVSLTSVSAVLDDGESYETADLHVTAGTGVVVRKDGGCFSGPLAVTYSAGRGTVPAAVNLAARIIVQHLWSTQRGSAGPRFGGDLVSMPGMGFLIPNQAAALLEAYRAPDGVA